MQQLGPNGGICAHGKGELPLWTCQATGALDDFASQGAELFEGPQRRPFFSGVSDRVGTEHLQFPVEIVRHYGREHEGGVTPLQWTVPHLGSEPRPCAGYVAARS